MSFIGVIHTAFGIAALLFGFIVVLRPKGTRTHRYLGWAYAASMLGLLSTSFTIYRLFGRFGVFHVLTVVALITLVVGILPAYFKRPRMGWIDLHYYQMSYSYVGLVAATGAEIAVRVPGANFKWAVGVASGIVVLVGALIIKARAKSILARMKSQWGEMDNTKPGRAA